MGGQDPPPVQASENKCSNQYIIPQYDGNISLSSQSIFSEPLCTCCDMSDSCSIPDLDLDLEVSEYSQPIPVLEPLLCSVCSSVIDHPVWYEEYRAPVHEKNGSKPNLAPVNRDNRRVVGLSLPIISVSNCRSLSPKLYNFKNDIIQRGISVSMCSEVWEKAHCKKQKFEFEKMLQMEGLKYISTPRTTKRGGGAAIIVNKLGLSSAKLRS